MDNYSNYDYAKNYSGLLVYNKNLDTVYKMTKELFDKGWKVNGSSTRNCGFGLGCSQWTWDRTYDLVKCYRKENGGRAAITETETIIGECNMMFDEMEDDYYYTRNYVKWKNDNAKVDINSSEAAKSAGVIICKNYEIPKADTSEARGTLAGKIYNDMVK